VAHQHCGQLGKQANCQVAVSLSLANHAASLPVAYRLYLPKAWAEDDGRRAKAGVPANIVFKTKPEIALDHIRWACEIGLHGDMALLDARYGHDAKLRMGITELGKHYVAGIQPQTLVWKPGKRSGRAPQKGRRLLIEWPEGDPADAAWSRENSAASGERADAGSCQRSRRRLPADRSQVG
jgi:SRSO17 transposase